MTEVLDIEITKSMDLIHVGDEFLLYVTIRNKFLQPIQKIGVTYDFPRGFFIWGKENQDALTKPRSRWQGFLQDYFYLPSETPTVFGSKRCMSWSVNILPGESYNITIPLRVGSFFPSRLKPDMYHLVFDITYTTNEEDHSFQARTDLIVYPHVGGVYLGAALGGVIGTILRFPQKPTPSLLELLIGSLSGFVMAIVFRRKANVQSFIAVEDFWGGFLIGIVAGYGGQQVLGSFLSPGSSGR